MIMMIMISPDLNHQSNLRSPFAFHLFNNYLTHFTPVYLSDIETGTYEYGTFYRTRDDYPAHSVFQKKSVE
jgi:hypothetical protein